MLSSSQNSFLPLFTSPKQLATDFISSDYFAQNTNNTSSLAMMFCIMDVEQVVKHHKRRAHLEKKMECFKHNSMMPNE